MKIKLSEALIKEYREEAIYSDRSIYLWDIVQRGLGCYVSPSGLVTWIAQKWTGGTNGKATRRKIGTFPETPLDKARNRALVELGRLANGEEVTQTHQQRVQQQLAHLQRTTVGQAFAAYYRHRTGLDIDLVNKDTELDRYWKEVKRLFEKHVEAVVGHNTAIADIASPGIEAVLKRLDDAPATKRFVYDFLGPFFKHLEKREQISKNPMDRIDAPKISAERDRVLTDQEIIYIWRTAEIIGFPFGKFFQLLLLTAQRRTELAQIKWSEFDFERKLLTIPMERTKTDRAHLVPLSAQSITVLQSIPKRFDHVFCSDHRNPDRHPISGFSKAKAELDRLSTIRDYTLHDFRRTAATGMAMLKHPPHVIDKVLNHVVSQKGRRIYLRFEYLDERRLALDDWGAHIAKLIA